MATQQNDYITIAEYATRRGVSVSAVYKRLGKTLKKYCKEINGKKYISVNALVEEGITPPVEKVEEGITPPPAVLVALDVMEKQLAEKDLQIRRLQEEAEELRKANAQKDVFIQEQSGKILVLLEQAQELNRNNQVLLGIEKGITPPVEKVEESIIPPVEAQGSPGAEENQEAQAEAPAENTPGTKGKRGFWGRLFGGRK